MKKIFLLFIGLSFSALSIAQTEVDQKAVEAEKKAVAGELVPVEEQPDAVIRRAPHEVPLKSVNSGDIRQNSKNPDNSTESQQLSPANPATEQNPATMKRIERSPDAPKPNSQQGAKPQK